MAYKIQDTCISCGACESECPVSCISQGDDKYVINPDECIECGLRQKSLHEPEDRNRKSLTK